MAIPVTTRTAKGSPLTRNEMDTNLTNVARSATEGQEGNIQIATLAETTSFSGADKSVVPSHLLEGLWSFVENILGNSGSSVSDTQGCIALPLSSDEDPILFQWGRIDVGGSNSETTITFPRPFTRDISSISTSGYGPPYTQDWDNSPSQIEAFVGNVRGSLTLSGFRVFHSTQNMPIYKISYLAIGR